jgi:hypothetical protein
VRVGPEAYTASLALPFVSEMDLTGRPLRGLLLVDGEGVAEDGAAGVARPRGRLHRLAPAQVSTGLRMAKPHRPHEESAAQTP